MDYAHTLRGPDGLVHVVVTNRRSIKTNGRHHTVCAKEVDESFQKFYAHFEPGRSAPVTCSPCLSFMTVLLDFVEADDESQPPSDSDLLPEALVERMRLRGHLPEAAS